MFVSFKKYQKIGLARMVNIKVIRNDKDVIYQGDIKDAPEEIKNMFYYKTEVSSEVTIFYVYADDYLATLNMDELNKHA